MKKLMITVLFIGCISAFGQSKNKVVDLLTKPNTPITKAYKALGSIDNNIKFDIIEISNLTTDTIVGGLVISTNRSNQTIESILDKSEVSTLNKVIKKLINDSTVTQHGQVEITTTNNFSFMVTYSDIIKRFMYRIYVSKSNSNSEYNFGKETLIELSDYLQKAETALKKDF